MNSLFHVAIISRTGLFVARNSFRRFSSPLWRRNFELAAIRTVNLEFPLTTRFHLVQPYSKRANRVESHSRKSAPKLTMQEEKNAFFIVRKGDIVGIYKNLSDSQAQVGSSICDPPVSVYKGYSMAKETEDYLLSCGLKNALYSLRAADLKEELFGTLMPCPFQQPLLSKDEPTKDLQIERLPQLLVAETGRSCIIEFDGASKGNPGQAGAGVVLRADDGNIICKLREGLGVRTNNAAEYRAMILGLRYALEKGFTRIRVVGDSKLVCMQIQGLWKVKNENMSILCEEAKILKDKFHSFQISHVLRLRYNGGFVKIFSKENIALGKVQKQIKCEIVKSSSFDSQESVDRRIHGPQLAVLISEKNPVIESYMANGYIDSREETFSDEYNGEDDEEGEVLIATWEDTKESSENLISSVPSNQQDKLHFNEKKNPNSKISVSANGEKMKETANNKK